MPRRGFKNKTTKKQHRNNLLEQLPKHSVGMEIGVWKGEFTEQILDAIKPTTLHLVDPWLYQPEFPVTNFGGKKAKSQRDMDIVFCAIQMMLEDKDNIVLHKEKSEVALPQMPDDSLDWAYIDGNHLEEYVAADLNQSRRLVKNGGFIAGDDYGGFERRPRLKQRLAGVKLAVDKFANQYGYQVQLFGSQFLMQVNK